jgi:hypothetical protein
LKGVAKLAEKGVPLSQYNLDGLAHNTERFRTLNFGIFKFVDSLSFMDSSLDKIVQDLTAGEHTFPILRKSGLLGNGVSASGKIEEGNEQAEKRLKLLTRKGCFPYSALRSTEEFRAMTSVPPIEVFHSNLTGESLSAEDYEHAKEVFEVFGCKSMLDYLLLYNITGKIEYML